MSKDGEMRTYPQLPSQYQEPMVPEESPEWTAEVVKHFATPEQLAFFEEQGYLIVENAIEPALLARLQEVCSTIATEQREKGGMGSTEPVRLMRSVAMHDVFLELLHNPRTFPLLFQIMGWNISLYISQMIDYPSADPKDKPPPGTPRGKGWHIDGGRPVVDMMFPQPMLSLKIGYWLTDTTHPDSGAMLLVPRSHKSNHVPNPEVLGGGVESANGRAGERPEGKDPDGAIPLRVKPGTAVLFDRRIWHSVGRNYSGNTRQSLFFGYGYRWLRGLDYNVMPDALLDKCSPVQRQLLGDGHDIKGWWQPTEADVPLKKWVEKHAADTPKLCSPSQMIFPASLYVANPFGPERAGAEVAAQAQPRPKL